MNLRDIAVVAPLTFALARDFNISTHAVVEAVIDHLPKRNLNFDNLAKLVVSISLPQPQCPSYERALAVGTVHLPFIDLGDYFALPRADQQSLVLEILATSVGVIETAAGVEGSTIRSAIAAVRDLGLPRPEIPMEHLKQRWGLS